MHPMSQSMDTFEDPCFGSDSLIGDHLKSKWLTMPEFGSLPAATGT